jgi:ribosomal-protein-alanine acetyltransferase
MAAIARTATIAIRPLRADDMRAVERIERAAYGSASPRTPFRRELRNGLAEYVVAEVADRTDAQPPGGGPLGGLLERLAPRLGLRGRPEPLAGFAGAWFTHDQLHLVTIAVAPERQGEGVAQALLLAVCDIAVEAGLDSVALEVRPSNARAIGLYEGYGFRHHGRLRRYYADNDEDALVMLLDGLASPEGRAALDARRAEHTRRYGAPLSTA